MGAAIDRGQVKIIFLELETLFSINNHLLTSLLARFRDWTPDAKVWLLK
jgi:hypothetical protein